MDKQVTRAIEPATLAAMLEDDEELALLDARDEGDFAQSHLLFAACMPLSRLEERMGSLVPRSGTRIVFTSGVDELAAAAADRARTLGYANVGVLAGGNDGWQRAEYRLFQGIHVPSKAFGELVERVCATPMIEPEALKALLDSGRRIPIFDSRPPHEFLRMNIPGAVNCPGGELVYRVPSALNSNDTMVVVNCAGRTRSIIGAQSLINAGLDRSVVALKNGTMGWHLAGYPLEHGNRRRLGAPGDSGRALAARMAAAVRDRFGVHRIEADELVRFRAECMHRSLYIFDVRDAEEFEAGHLEGSRHAPGGQLMQATDAYIATRNSRIVLVDSDGVRATMAASWLMQMGWRDVFTYECTGEIDRLNVRGPTANAWPPRPANIETVSVGDLKTLLDTGAATLIDVAMSADYRQSHVAGAHFAIRSRFGRSLASFPADTTLVLTSADGRLAEFAAHDAAVAHAGPVRVLAGGTSAWHAAELPMEAGFDAALDPPADMWHIPSSALGGGEPAMRQYLSWEVDLIDQIAGEPGVRFRVPEATTVGDPL